MAMSFLFMTVLLLLKSRYVVLKAINISRMKTESVMLSVQDHLFSHDKNLVLSSFMSNASPHGVMKQARTRAIVAKKSHSLMYKLI